MRLAIFEHATAGDDAQQQLGLVTSDGVVPVDLFDARSAGGALRELIVHFDEVGPRLSELVGRSDAIAHDDVRLLAPLASPSKIVCSLRVTAKPEGTVQRHVFLKAPGSAIGDGGEVVLPELDGAEAFTHNVGPAVFWGGRCRAAAAAEWRQVVFGYTAMIDITGRTDVLSRWKLGKSALGSSCDTFGPLGPWIVPAGSFDESAGIGLELSCNGRLRQKARLEDLDDQIGTVIELASTIMTLHPGDVVAVEATAEGQGPVQDGDELQVELDQVGRLVATVRDPYGRSWDPEVRVAFDADSTDGQPAPPATA
jgi:2-keto-4-pentenoate hydratase/2-oxohepta-3-ene-1,7-dioic acid hydratase in catechol pathway